MSLSCEAKADYCNSCNAVRKLFQEGRKTEDPGEILGGRLFHKKRLCHVTSLSLCLFGPNPSYVQKRLQCRAAPASVALSCSRVNTHSLPPFVLVIRFEIERGSLSFPTAHQWWCWQMISTIYLYWRWYILWIVNGWCWWKTLGSQLKLHYFLIHLYPMHPSALPPARILPRAAGKLETRFPRHVQTDLRHPLRAE